MTANPELNVNVNEAVANDISRAAGEIRLGIERLKEMGGMIEIARTGRKAMSDGLRAFLPLISQETLENGLKALLDEGVKGLPELGELNELMSEWGIDIPRMDDRNEWEPGMRWLMSFCGVYPMDVIVDNFGEEGLRSMCRICQDAIERRWGIEALEAAYGRQWSEACRYCEDLIVETARRQVARRRAQAEEAKA